MRRLLCALALPMLLGAGSDVPVMTATRVAQSQADLARYVNSHTIGDLEAAAEDLEGTIALDDLSGENFTATRRMLVHAWATVLKAVEGAYDPKFDPKDPKNRVPGCVPSPHPAPTSSTIVSPGVGMGYLTCSDATNRSWQYYIQVSRIDRRATTNLEMSLNLLNSVAPIGYGFDYDALDRILQQSGIGKARRAEIDQAMVESGPHQWRVPLNASETEVPAGTAASINASSIALARYTSSHELSDLNQAVDALGERIDVDALTGSNFDKTRTALMQAWAAVIKSTEEAHDQTLDNRAIGSLVALLRQFNSNCASCAQSSADLNKLLQQAGLNQATCARIVAGTARMLPLASP